MKCISAVLLLVLTGSLLPAQRKIVIPPGMATKAAPGWLPVLLDYTKPSASRGLQAVFRAGPKDGGKVAAMSFRPVSNAASSTPSFTVVMELGFSTFSKRIVELGPFLSRNRGKDFIQVFKGSVSFPAVPAKLRKISPFVFRIPFQKIYTMKANSTVLWDMVVKSSTQYASASNQGAYIEVYGGWPYQDPRYRVTRSGKSCPRAGVDNMLVATNMAVGHRFFMVKDQASNWNANSLGVLMLGASKSKWGPVKLPFSLQRFGAPGCSIYVSPDAYLPVFFRGGGAMTLGTAVLPRQLSLAGQTVYGQGFVLNAKNQLGLQSSNMVEWKIGPWFPIPFAYAYSNVNFYMSKIGLPHDSNIPVFQLEIQ